MYAPRPIESLSIGDTIWDDRLDGSQHGEVFDIFTYADDTDPDSVPAYEVEVRIAGYRDYDSPEHRGRYHFIGFSGGETVEVWDDARSESEAA